jgi:CRP-like cAMP-binding protein
MFDRRLRSGVTVVTRGERLGFWIGVADGLLHAFRSTRRGKTIGGFGILMAGHWFGEDCLVDGFALPYDIRALRDCRLVFLTRATFMALLDESIEFNRFVVQQQINRSRSLIEQIEVRGLHDPEARLARCLASLAEGLGPVLQVSQEELGRLVGMSRQLTNRAVQALREKRLLSTQHRQITLLDPEALRRYSA